MLAAALCSAAAWALHAALPTPARARPTTDDTRVRFTVDDPRDLSDANPGDGRCAAAPDGRCTLRAAVEEAGATLWSTTVVLPAGTYTVTHGHIELGLAGGDYLGIVVPPGADVAVEGAGPDNTLVAVGDGVKPNPLRPFVVKDGGRLTVRGVTLRGAQYAGGVLVFGRLDLADVLLTGVKESHSLVRVGPGATVAITGTVVAGNDVGSVLDGDTRSAMSVISSTIQDNRLGLVAGARDEASLRIEASAIVVNEARAILNGTGPITVERTTIAYNVLTSPYDVAVVSSDEVALRHVTIAANTVATSEPGLVARGLLTDPHLFVVSAQRLTLVASVFGANDGIGTLGLDDATCSIGALDSTGDSVVQAAGCADAARGDRVVDDADLGGLEDAGGPTPVVLPRPSSPAIGASPGPCPAADQRGARLPTAGPCAAGAADPTAARPPSALRWPIRPTMPRGGSDAPRAAERFLGPPTALAVRSGLGVAAHDGFAEALFATGGAVAVGGANVLVGAPVIEAALDGTTAWLMHKDTRVTAVDVADPHAPRIVGRIDAPIARDLDHDVTGLRLFVPSPGVLWRIGWRGEGLRGYPHYVVECWDVSRASEPVRRGSLDMGVGRDPWGIAWSDRRVVTALLAFFPFNSVPVRELRVFDVIPEGPVSNGRTLALDGQPGRVVVFGGHAFVRVFNRDGGRPEGVQVVDLGDAQQPATVGWWPEPWDDFVAFPGGLLLQRGTTLARADVTDPLHPRIIASAIWSTPPAELRATDGDPIARLNDGRFARVDVTAPGGPRPVDVPTGGDAVLAVAGAGEDLAWRAGDGRWRTAAPDTPARPWRALPGGAWATDRVAVADGVAWQASVRGVEGFAVRVDGGPLGTADAVGATAIAAAGHRLWTLQPGRLALWDVADPTRPTLVRAVAVAEDIPGPGLAADSEGAVLWSDTGRVWLVSPDEPGSVLPPPDIAIAGPLVSAAREGGRLAILDSQTLRAYDISSGTPRPLGEVAVPGTGRGLALVGGRAYAVAAQRIYVADVSGATAASITMAPAPGASGPIAFAGGRLFAAGGGDGLFVYTVGAPERPALLAACGTTWPGPRFVVVRAPARRGSCCAAMGSPWHRACRAAPVGPRTWRRCRSRSPSAAASSTPSPTGAPLRRDRASRWCCRPSPTSCSTRPASRSMTARRGTHHPSDAAGCATKPDGWSIRSTPGAPSRSPCRVRPDLAARAAVTATIGERAVRLAPGRGDPPLFVGTVPAASGPVMDASAIVEVAADDARVVWRGRAVGRQAWLPWAGR
ncbi:MAG: choice-of-anchor Q domain-containing protein [Anaerolineae bacterium]